MCLYHIKSKNPFSFKKNGFVLANHFFGLSFNKWHIKAPDLSRCLDYLTGIVPLNMKKSPTTVTAGKGTYFKLEEKLSPEKLWLVGDLPRMPKYLSFWLENYCYPLKYTFNPPCSEWTYIRIFGTIFTFKNICRISSSQKKPLF